MKQNLNWTHDNSFRLKIENKNTLLGCRVGGLPPEGIKLIYPEERTKYFGTFPLLGHEGLMYSIYYSLDMTGVEVNRDMLDYNNQILYNSVLIQAICHQDAKRGGLYCGQGMAACSIDILTKRSDWEVFSNERVVSTYSKLGGRPYLYRGVIVEDCFDKLIRDGFRQILQFVTPDPNIEGYAKNCPWDPGSLHVFCRPGHVTVDFAFVIQQ